jgi:hypothetical protein
MITTKRIECHTQRNGQSGNVNGRPRAGPSARTRRFSGRTRHRNEDSAEVEDVYLLVLHEQYESRSIPGPIDATIAHALTLLHPAVPQPDGGRMYRCPTEFPSRVPGCLVPLSTLTFELDGGRLWPQIADWEAVVAAVASLRRARDCDALPLGLPATTAALLGPGRRHLPPSTTRTGACRLWAGGTAGVHPGTR